MIDRKHPAEDERRASPPRVAFVRVAGPAPLVLRVDHAGPAPAMVRGPHASLSHLEACLPELARPLLPALERAIREADAWQQAVRRVEACLAEAGLPADRRDEPGRVVRRHPALRAPRAGGPPIDHELLALERGERALIKRMSPGEGLEADARALSARGLSARVTATTRHEREARHVLLVAREPATLAAAAALESALEEATRARRDDAAVVRELGALLGYPRCCVERFVSLRARDDASLAGALLPAHDTPQAFETAFTIVPFALVSHAPCSARCEATRALVGRLLAALPAAEREAYRALADARWGIDDDGFLVRIDARGAERIDPADPELVRTSSARAREDALHWRIATSLTTA